MFQSWAEALRPATNTRSESPCPATPRTSCDRRRYRQAAQCLGLPRVAQLRRAKLRKPGRCAVQIYSRSQASIAPPNYVVLVSISPTKNAKKSVPLSAALAAESAPDTAANTTESAWIASKDDIRRTIPASIRRGQHNIAQLAHALRGDDLEVRAHDLSRLSAATALDRGGRERQFRPTESFGKTARRAALDTSQPQQTPNRSSVNQSWCAWVR